MKTKWRPPRSRCLLMVYRARLLAARPAAYLSGQAPTPIPGPRLAVSASPAPFVSAREGYPLSRARVSLRDVKNPQYLISMITGDDGRFEFSNLPAGKYSLLGAKRGYITAAYDQHEQFSTAIVTGAGLDTENLNLRLASTAVITGHVLDEFGEAVRNASVTLWRDDHSAGIGRTVPVQTDQSDDQGLFEFAPLDAGTYFVSAAAKPWYAVHAPSIRQTGAPDTPTSVDPSLSTRLTCPRTTRELRKWKKPRPSSSAEVITSILISISRPCPPCTSSCTVPRKKTGRSLRFRCSCGATSVACNSHFRPRCR